MPSSTILPFYVFVVCVPLTRGSLIRKEIHENEAFNLEGGPHESRD